MQGAGDRGNASVVRELLACSGFKRWNGVLLVVELSDGSPGTVRADATDIFASAPAPTELVLDGEGIHALHGLVVALQRRPGSRWKGPGSARPCSRQRFREGEPICAP